MQMVALTCHPPSIPKWRRRRSSGILDRKLQARAQLAQRAAASSAEAKRRLTEAKNENERKLETATARAEEAAADVSRQRSALESAIARLNAYFSVDAGHGCG